MAFLTILTRHMPKRAHLLKENVHSLQAQTDLDYEQLVLVDEVGRGFDYANRMVIEAACRVRGEYVLILDDDDLMENVRGVELLKQAAASRPPAVIFKGKHAELGILPEAEYWQLPPACGHIGSFDFILRRDVFQRHAHAFAKGYAADYDLIRSVWVEHAAEIAWLDEVICRAPRRSIGRTK